MQVRREGNYWLLRWTSYELPSNVGLVSVRNPLHDCANCGTGENWINVTDLWPMPTPQTVSACELCGTTTAHASLLMTARPWEDRAAARSR